MKKSNILLAFIILLVIAACSSDSEEMNQTSSIGERSWSFNGGSLIGIDTLDGQFSSDYDASPTINGVFGGISWNEGVSLGVYLFDEDENSFPFTNNGIFPINDNPIRATLSYEDFSANKRLIATSGSVTVTKFDRVMVGNRSFIQISGTFNVSDATENLEGTFNNIRMLCLECE